MAISLEDEEIRAAKTPIRLKKKAMWYIYAGLQGLDLVAR